MCTSSQKPYQFSILQKTQALNFKKELPSYPPAPATLVRPLLSSLGSSLKMTIKQRLRPPSQSLIQPDCNPELLWELRIISEKEMILSRKRRERQIANWQWISSQHPSLSQESIWSVGPVPFPTVFQKKCQMFAWYLRLTYCIPLPLQRNNMDKGIV